MRRLPLGILATVLLVAAAPLAAAFLSRPANRRQQFSDEKDSGRPAQTLTAGRGGSGSSLPGHQLTLSVTGPLVSARRAFQAAGGRAGSKATPSR